MPALPSRPAAHNAAPDAAPPRGVRTTIDTFIESAPVQRFIIAVIIANAVTMGLATSPAIMATAGGVIRALDVAFLAVFVIEIVAKVVGRGWRFFADGWNVFDFLVVAIALIPASGPLAVLRALRVLRVLRLISVLPTLRNIVNTLLAAIPGIASIAGLLGILFYVSAVMTTQLFGASFPEWFGSLGASLYSLFQIMTLESWSMGIVRPVMEVYPWAWGFFVPFILLSAFTMLNLFIAVIIDTMQNVQKARESRLEAEADADADADDEAADAGHATSAQPIVGPVTHAEREPDAELLEELARVRAQLDALTSAVERRGC